MEGNKGFTLIELMIVVVIIGVLAALSLPIYQGYVIKTQVNRVVSESASLRTSIETCLSESRLTIGVGTGDCTPETVSSNLIDGASQVGDVVSAGKGVPQISSPLGNEATITATFGNSAQAGLVASGAQVVWTRTPEGGWNCSTPGLDAIYATSACP